MQTCCREVIGGLSIPSPLPQTTNEQRASCPRAHLLCTSHVEWEDGFTCHWIHCRLWCMGCLKDLTKYQYEVVERSKAVQTGQRIEYESQRYRSNGYAFSCAGIYKSPYTKSAFNRHFWLCEFPVLLHMRCKRSDLHPNPRPSMLVSIGGHEPGYLVAM